MKTPGNRQDLFKETIEQHRDRVYRICCCYVRDEETRKDLFQEILVHIWQNLDGFEGRAEIGTWVYRIAVNTCLGHVRSEKSRSRLFEWAAKTELTSFGTWIQSDALQIEQELAALYDCIGQLPSLERTLVSLYLEDIGTHEMAEILGISEANVRVKLHRTKRTLKEMWERNGYDTR